MKDYSREADECHKLVTEIVSKEFTLENLVYFVTKTMEVVENLEIDELTGVQKKQLVISIINKFIRETELDEDKKALLYATVQVILPNLIDSIVAASDGLIDINQIKQTNLCGLCIPLSSKKK